MHCKLGFWMVIMLLWVACLPASAQAVYKCGVGRTTTYSQVPCGGRAISTDEAPVPTRDGVRRQRVAMAKSDREECARLRKRIPFEQARMRSANAIQALEGEEALAASLRRFAQLRC